MTVKILHDSYGKSRVRLIKVARDTARHEVQSLTLNIALEGDFDAVHRAGDNSLCLPTDTMKNTVYALAGQTREIESPEAFGHRLASHFLANNPQVSRATINIRETRWERMNLSGQEHTHSFMKGGEERRTACVAASRDGVTVSAGIDDLIVMKTTGSGFAGYLKDELTTLPETHDRILATSMKVAWRYTNLDAALTARYSAIREEILHVFADHDSRSVQHTLYAMGQAILEKFGEIEEISFSLPNIHCLSVDMTRFGQQNDNRIFVPTDEPHGLIEARLAR